jgi:DNA-binding beta-propeller fold protein YncE
MRSRQSNLRIGATLLAALGLFGLNQSAHEIVAAQARQGAQAPRFEVDRLWPKPLPKMWILGSVNGVAVDAQDHIWITHGGVNSLQGNEKGPELKPPQSTCCFAAPQVLEFDAAGNLLGQWGGAGQGYDWPLVPQGIAVDSKGNVIIGGSQLGHVEGRPDPPPPAGRGGAKPAKPVPLPPQDAHVIKFTRTGQFVWQFGKPATVEGNNGTTSVSRPAGFDVDEAANEVYIADGLGNRRVVVVDAGTGAYKRHWGAYGGKPDDTAPPPYNPNPASNAPLPRQFQNVSCVKLSKDGMVYVCDRGGNRIQVFQKDGKFVKEAIVSPATMGDGSVWDLAFSRDPQQQFVYVADGQDKKILVLRRDTLDVVSSFGQGGRLPGTFYAVGSIAVDSKGNVYTGETSEGKRVQKFIYKGLGPASTQ